jgi:hypothetical protein
MIQGTFEDIQEYFRDIKGTFRETLMEHFGTFREHFKTQGRRASRYIMLFGVPTSKVSVP